MKKTCFIAATIGFLFASAAMAQNQSTGTIEQKINNEPLIGKAVKIPVTTAVPIISLSPIILSAPGREVELQIKVTAPSTGKNLPIIILSHGHGKSNYLSSFNGYEPLVNFLATHGFIVIQPTHLDAKFLQLNPNGPEGPVYWRTRMQDIKNILDQFEAIEKAFPEIQGRMDTSKVAIIGHSMGGFTAGMLLGEKNKDKNGVVVDMSDSRIKTGVLLSAPGDRDGLTLLVSIFFKDYNPDFTTMKKPVLVFVGDKDKSKQLTNKGYKWHADAYRLSTGSKSLVTLFGGKHNLGGISGYDAAETDDENPERVAIVERLTWAYLRTALYPDDQAWIKASAAFAEMKGIGLLENK